MPQCGAPPLACWNEVEIPPSGLERSGNPAIGAPPVVAKRTSRYRGPVAPEDRTGVKFLPR
jgi:hypothetical protein